ncbi:MAG: insulinase family protein [Cyclobacteriaceae bacterium]|nr:insulinase family protein [Cyclobacteriaceae bacterium]
MIKYQEHLLSNGLTLITHVDKSAPLVVVNILYKVGSRNEQPGRTGFAHLFEHLMFGGSKNVPDYDKHLQKAGAENNAFTNTDITNYYIILSAENIETALWVESDRMQFLNLDKKNLATQKKVVVEEFKQRYLNVPYGDVWLKLLPLAYHVHPYQWPTIGKEISHIEKASLKNVREFHEKHYAPNNAVLTISGNIDPTNAYELAKKWFGNIPANQNGHDQITSEPRQTSSRFLEIDANVPLNSIYKVYHMPGRINKKYVTADLLSDLLGRGKSSRLYQSLVKDKKVFNDINSYITGSADPGLLIISGKVNPDIDIVDAEKRIVDEIDLLKNNLKETEVEKVINQAVSSTYFSETELLNRSINLSVANSLGNTNLVNEEIELVGKVKKTDILNMANEILVTSNCSTLHYKSKK